jgi:hypothetical protein
LQPRHKHAAFGCRQLAAQALLELPREHSQTRVEQRLEHGGAPARDHDAHHGLVGHELVE